MPVKSPVKPKDKDVLRSKILAAEPSDEGLRVIMAAVKYHLDLTGYATYEQTIEDDTREVGLKYPKCMVFLIRGAFEIRGTLIQQDGLGHPVEDEDSLQLLENTAVVIISTI
ncbi:hypothetical protein V498_08583 [Pseudogymnoascus sp. VKM F-4517 (FW-2822)]|nr:hypothetical protein V498_08583 [Pseudogymnoascus sp. VKM F-4517 (FW-2822)]